MVKPSRSLQYKGKIRNLPLVYLLVAAALSVNVACDEAGVAPTQIPAAPTAGPASPINGNAAPTHTLGTSNAKTVTAPGSYSSKPTSTSHPITATPGSFVPSPIVDYETAWGRRLAINRIPLTLMPGHQLVADTATPDGKELVGSLTTVDFNEKGGSAPGKAVLVDIQTHSIAVIHNFQMNDTQMLGASADARWIVWTEAAQDPGMFADWSLYAYDRASKVTKQLATAPRDQTGTPLPSPFVLPRVNHGVAVWIEASPDPASSLGGIVKSIDLTTGRINVLAQNALAPTIYWPYVGWVAVSAEPSKQLEGAQKSSIVLLNIETGAKRILLHPDTPSYFEIYKDSLVWVTGMMDEVNLTDLDESYQRTIARWDGSDALEFPSLNDRLVSWTGNGIPQVWDREQNRIVQLESKPDYGQFVVANALVWLSPVTDQQENAPGPALDRTINVLTMSQLSK